MKKFANFWQMKSVVDDLVLLCEEQNNQPHRRQHNNTTVNVNHSPPTVTTTAPSPPLAPSAPELDVVRTSHAMVRRSSLLAATNHLVNGVNSRLLEVPIVEKRRHSKEMRRNSRDASRRRNSRKQSRFTISRPECPICFEEFTSSSRIFQCDEGHLYCEECKGNLRKLECPQCRIPLSNKGLRNRFLESMLKMQSNH